ncbi:phosphate/phosphite/phosphonate ABC transporter substrate-binding protein [Pendulispora albinea]|uniref:PhnD/SsuA/transferrin family substrate-binding protein n=1 Tax=Pendulispora albinea TaxID=2741071 RepID=A0ABZ2LXY6_9BACT
MGSPQPKRLVFALAWQGGSEPVAERFGELTAWLSEKTGFSITPRMALSYVELERMVRSGQAHIAWLPPLIFLRLEREGQIVHLVKSERAGHASFHAAMIVRTDSPIRSLEMLRGSRAAWVDRWSASGYVIPRAILIAKGLTPKDLFREERFYGSHEAVVGAVLSGRANLGGTYAQLTEKGTLLRGAWSNVRGGESNVRVLMTVGSIPGDLLAAHVALNEEERQVLTQALLAVPKDALMGKIMRRIFGAESFRDGPLTGYDVLRGAIDDGPK